MADVEIHIIEADTSPVRLNVNDRTAVIIVGVDATIDEMFIPALSDCNTVRWHYVGQLPPDAVEQSVEDDFDADAVIAGTIDEVKARLADLTPVQLQRVREAEVDREKPRSGLMSVIDKLITEQN